MRLRMIEDNMLLEMLKQGKQQKEIAEHFKVSPVAVCKRIKRLLPQPKSLDALSEKERKFCLAVSKGHTATQAALQSYEAGSLQSAKVIGSQLMDKPEIKMAIDELLDYHGLTRSYRVQRLKKHVDHVDPNISLKALDMSWKLDGNYAPEKFLTANLHYQHVHEVVRKTEAAIKETEAMLRELETQTVAGTEEKTTVAD